MNTKTKTALAVVALLGVGYVGATAWLGQRVQSAYEAQSERLASMISGYGKMTERQYQRGFFSAQNRYVLELDEQLMAQLSRTDMDEDEDEDDGEGEREAKAAEPLPKLRLHIVEDIRHGPLAGGKLAAAAVRARLERVEGATDALRQMFAKVPEPDIRATVHFNGATDTRWALAAGELRFSPEAVLSWQGMEQTLAFSADMLHQKGHITLPQVQLQVTLPNLGGMNDDEDEDESADSAASTPPQPWRLQLDQARIDLDNQYDGQQWLMSAGQNAFKADKLSLQAPGRDGAAPREVFMLDKLNVQAKGTREGEFYAVHATGTATGALNGTPLQSVRSETRIERVHGPALGELEKLWRSMDVAKTEDDIDPEKAKQMIALAGRLLDAKPTYDSQLDITAEGQTAQIRNQISVGEAADSPLAGLLDSLPPTAQMQLQIMSRLKLDANLRLPKAWLPIIERVAQNPNLTADQMNMLMQSMVQQGVLEEDEQAFSLKAEFGEGALKLNGRPMFGGG